MKAPRCRSPFKLLVAIVCTAALNGCAATQVAISKKNLDVQTKMSDSIFLDPVEPEQRTIYIRIRNTTDKDFFLEDAVKAAIANVGFQVTDSPKRARYRLEAQILSVEKASPTASQAVLANGYGGATVPLAAVGAGIGHAAGGWAGAGYGGLVGGIVGGAGELVTGAFVKDVTFMVVTDVQLTENSPDGAYVRTDLQVDNKQGTTGRSSQIVSSVGDKIKYRVRIVSTANKANLKFEEAHTKLANGIARSLSGLF
jgi:hypothetical protein